MIPTTPEGWAEKTLARMRRSDPRAAAEIEKRVKKVQKEARGPFRVLKEAAEAIGWTAGIDSDGDPFIASPHGGEVYIKGGFVHTSWDPPVDTPVELMALLIEAAR